MNTTANTSSTNGGDKELQIISAVVGSIFCAGILALLVFWARTALHSRSRLRKLNKNNTGDTSEAADAADAHIEPHFTGAEVVRDIVVGLSDGLTVPFALTAGLSSLGNSRFVVVAGMAEIVAGGLSMGLGGYLAGRSEIEHYTAEETRERFEIRNVPEKEEEEIYEIFEPYGMHREDILPLLTRLKEKPELWIEFMMKYELNLEKPNSSRLWISA
ncbi:hypothetical protein HK100_010998, partial [Physocladia obscura]